MKITKNLLETLTGVMATKIAEVSPKGNYIPQKTIVNEAYKESLQAHELPSHVKDAVKKVHDVLKKHKIQGAHVSVAHHDYEPKHEKADGGHHEVNIQLGRHHIDNERLIDDLHSTQPHKWQHKKGDVQIAPCASIHPCPAHNIHHGMVNEDTMTDEQEANRERIVKGLKDNAEEFKKKYGVDWEGVMYATATKMAMKEEIDADVVEMLGEARYYHLARGESHGRHYKDEHGVTWDDEGHNSAGTGPSDRAYHTTHKYPPKQKHYHTVPYAKKEEAKGEGMRWDGDKKKWYHTDAGKSATSKFKKLHEEEEVLNPLEEGVGGYFKRTPASGTDTRAQMDKDYDKAHAAAKKAGQKPHALGYSHDASHVNIEADGGVKSKYNLKSGELSKGHHLKEEVELDEETKKKDVKPVPGELNKMALDQHLTKHEKHFMGFDNVRAKEAIADVQKMRSTHPSKLINGIGSHLEHLKGLTGFVQGSNKKPELTEELIGEMFNRDTGHSEKDSTVKGHLISVTVSDPNHTMVTKRDEQREKRISVKTGLGKDAAMKKAQAHYKKQGFKIHQVNHVKHLYEEVEDDILIEEFTTREAAEKAMAKHEAKHPLAKHTVMQGRRSGKWHVVRHTSGGMHVVEEIMEDDGNEELNEAAEGATTPLQKHVHKMWTGKKHYAGITAAGPAAHKGLSYSPRPGIKHSVQHHEDGSSTVTFHHSESVPHGYHDHQTHAVVSAIDHFREAHGHLHNATSKEVLNNKTKTLEGGYQAHKETHPMQIHTKTKDGVTKMHISSIAKPVKLKEEAEINEGDESEADFQSYLKAHRAGLDHHTKQDADIDNDGKKNDPNDKYLRNRRATIAKNIVKGK